MPSVSRPPEMSSSVTSSVAKGTGWRKFGDATSGPRRIRSVALAAAVSVGTAPNHVESRSERQARWSYVHAWSNPSSSARRHERCASAQGSSGRITTPSRIPAPTAAGSAALIAEARSW